MSDTFTDKILKRQLRISRFIIGMQQRIQGGLALHDKQLLSLISDFIETASPRDLASIPKAGYGSTAGKGFINDLLALLDGQADHIAKSVLSEVTDLAVSESKYIAGALVSEPISINDAVLHIRGNKVSDMITALMTRYQGRLLETISGAIKAGDDVIRSIRGTKDVNYKDGVFSGRNNDLTATSDYVASGVIANTRDLSYVRAGIKEVDWLATLDLRTCPTCANNEINSPYPIASAPDISHPRCRCVKIIHTSRNNTRPFVKDDRSVAKIPKGERKDKIGQTTLKFGAWFDGLSDDYKRQWLGKSRYDLYKDGKIKLDDLTAGNGRILTLKELDND